MTPRLPSDPYTWFALVVSAVVALSATAVFAAIALNFLAAKEAGRVAERRRGPVATATMVLFFVGYYLLLRFRVGVVETSRPVAVVLALVGLVPVVLGCVVNLLGRVRLGANWADHVTIYERQTLVTRGVFGVVRHPLYASLVWMFAGAALVFRNYAALLADLLIFLPAMNWRAAQEEKLLAARFPEYDAYRRRVARFFPRVWRAKDGNL